MRTFLRDPVALVRIQKGLLSSYALLFTIAAYILIWEIAHKLDWNEASYILLLTMAASFASLLAWARIEYNRILIKAEQLLEIGNSKKSAFQCRLDQLSFKERDVLSHILEGKSNKEICSQLFIEHSTLKSHINHIYKKLEVRSRKEMVLALK